MRKQYHFRSSERGLLAWDIDRLIALSAHLPVFDIALADIRELDQPFWFCHEGDQPTCRRIARHAQLIHDTDLNYPIILSQDGGVMDGMHRVCKAFITGLHAVRAVQFDSDPQPDYIGMNPEDLPY